MNVTASGMLKQVDAMSTSHEDIKLIKYSSQKEDYIPSNQGEYRPTRLQWQNQCSNHVSYQMDDKDRRPG